MSKYVKLDNWYENCYNLYKVTDMCTVHVVPLEAN